MTKEAKRYVGIRHRVKQTAEGESRPTQVAIIDQTGALKRIELATELEEFDFLHGRFPLSMREVAADEELSVFQPHHIVWRTLQKSEPRDNLNPTHVRKKEGKIQVAVKVPDTYNGLSKDDHVAMILGGSGDSFAYALSRKGEKIGATVFRIPPFSLKAERGEELKKDDDATLLATLCRDKQHLFFEVSDRDIPLILLSVVTQRRRQIQQERIACNNRVSRLVVGEVFCSEEGEYPEGGFQKAADQLIANDVVLSALTAEEKRVTKQLEAAAEKVLVYTRIFKPIEGVGPAIAGPIISVIGDIRRFATDSKLKAYCGVHVLKDGTFPRRRRGVVANWSGALRQALFLFGDQCVKRKDSKWGVYYRTAKARLREKHPEPIVIDGKKKYSDGHIHKMAIWRTLTRFVEWLFREWRKLERERGTLPLVENDNTNVVPISARSAQGGTVRPRRGANLGRANVKAPGTDGGKNEPGYTERVLHRDRRRGAGD